MIAQTHAMARYAGIFPTIATCDGQAHITCCQDVHRSTQGVGNPDYGKVPIRRTPVLIASVQTERPDTLAAASNQIVAPIRGDDVKRLWAERGQAIAEVPDGRMRAPFNRPHGPREFCFSSPDHFPLLLKKIQVWV